jgi:hypothetical protein
MGVALSRNEEAKRCMSSGMCMDCETCSLLAAVAQFKLDSAVLAFGHPGTLKEQRLVGGRPAVRCPIRFSKGALRISCPRGARRQLREERRLSRIRAAAHVKKFLYTVEASKSFEAAVEAVEEKVAEKGFSVVHTYDVASPLPWRLR